MKKGVMLIAVLLLLAGCGRKDAVTTANDAESTVTKEAQENTSEDADLVTNAPEEGFQFEYNGVSVPLNVDAAPIIESLGEPDQTSETASCAFQGMDKYFTYQSFEISTYPNEDKDYIYTIYFLDDSVTTDKDIYIGSAKAEVTAAYGEDYKEESGELTYTLGNTELSFIIKDDAVESITYTAIVEGLNN
jgi:predicted small lipoprotein YifL